MRHLRIVICESDGCEGEGGEYGDPDETIAQVGPEQRRDDDGDDDEQASHGWRTGFFLVGFWAFLANVLPDLEITQSADDEWPNNQGGKERGQAGEGGAEGDVAEDAERGNVVLQLQEQQPVEQLASECSRQLGTQLLAMSPER